ncbi:hypothetical protein F2P81_004548 [Scophthalmus maximus]|uniref:Uncharacterized protein n=1 Tax=Scophthalmus maximus TaxID=52904 RepID=A0A6A4TK00_SCOMX|nr:hypothetical protein F2P81_004548 [Scophthalmus maximus]
MNPVTSLVSASAGLRNGFDCLALISPLAPLRIQLFFFSTKKSVFAMTFGGRCTRRHAARTCVRDRRPAALPCLSCEQLSRLHVASRSCVSRVS